MPSRCVGTKYLRSRTYSIDGVTRQGSSPASSGSAMRAHNDLGAKRGMCLFPALFEPHGRVGYERLRHKHYAVPFRYSKARAHGVDAKIKPHGRVVYWHLRYKHYAVPFRYSKARAHGSDAKL